MKKSKATAVASFIFSLAFWIPLLNIIFGLFSVVLGIKALIKIKKEPDKYYGKLFALAGIALGSLPIALSIAGLAMCLAGYKDICRNMGLAFLAR